MVGRWCKCAVCAILVPPLHDSAKRCISRGSTIPEKIFARAIETKKYEANIASLVFLFTLLHFASAAITLLHLTVFYKVIAII